MQVDLCLFWSGLSLCQSLFLSLCVLLLFLSPVYRVNAVTTAEYSPDWRLIIVMGGGIRTSNAAIVTVSKYVLTLPNKRNHSHHCCEPAHTLTFKVFVYSNDALSSVALLGLDSSHFAGNETNTKEAVVKTKTFKKWFKNLICGPIFLFFLTLLFKM